MSLLSEIKKGLSELTGGSARKRREQDVEARQREIQQQTENFISDLQNTLSRLTGMSKDELMKNTEFRRAMERATTNYISTLAPRLGQEREVITGRLRDVLGEEFGEFGATRKELEDIIREASARNLEALRGETEAALAPSEQAQRQAFEEFAAGRLGEVTPEIEAQLAARGLSAKGGTFAAALAQQLRGLGEQRFGLEQQLAQQRQAAVLANAISAQQQQQALENMLFGTGLSQAQQQLQAGLGIGQTEAELQRQNDLYLRQLEMENFLRRLGIAREDELAQRGIQQNLQYNLPLQLVQQAGQLRLGNLGQQLQLDLAKLGAAQQREQGVLGLGGQLLGNIAQGYIGQLNPTNRLYNQYLTSAIRSNFGQPAGLYQPVNISETQRFLGQIPGLP